MRIRHRLFPEEVRENVRLANMPGDPPGPPWWAGFASMGKLNETTYYSRDAWLAIEPVPTETWRDVSSECEWDGNNCLAHRNGGRFGDEIVTAEKGYRLRKVTLAVHNQQAPLGVNPVEAFIIEKRTK